MELSIRNTFIFFFGIILVLLALSYFTMVRLEEKARREQSQADAAV